MLKSIALNVGIDVNDLSRFKGGMECLKYSDVKLLSEYLNAVIIPQWNTIVREPQKEKELKEKNLHCTGYSFKEKISLENYQTQLKKRRISI